MHARKLGRLLADLFGVKQPAISKHLNNIFKSGELDQVSVHSILEYTASDGKVYKTQFYNLDAILSVGYRVNSVNGCPATDRPERTAPLWPGNAKKQVLYLQITNNHYICPVRKGPCGEY